MAIIHRSTVPSERLERILIYGDPKTGKTRLGTSLTDRFWPAVYIASDEGAELLTSVLTEFRAKIGANILQLTRASKSDDPAADAFEIAAGNAVEKVCKEAKTIVWDTMTATSRQILQHIADAGQFSQSQHIAIGPVGSAARQNIPMQGDYMAAQNTLDRLVGFLFQRPQHIIVLCHLGYDEPQSGGPAEYGPATVGRATIRTFPGRFDSVIHVEKGRSVVSGPGKESRPSVTAYTERHGFWSAGIRSHHASNPMPKVILDDNPINFWKQYDECFGSPAVPVLDRVEVNR